MKIIQVVGRSNSGKTSFIKKLIPELKKKGRVAVIKHLGDHEFGLEKEKDTTQFFDAGASISFGVDKKKSVGAFQTNRLEDLLSLFKEQGVKYAVIEGFKTYGFPKIVIGDLVAENCIAVNPSVQEVLAGIERFEDYPKKDTNKHKERR